MSAHGPQPPPRPSLDDATLRVICCPDSFKGTATAAEAAAALAAGARDAGADAVAVPMADGGEGTAALLAAGPARRVATVDAASRPTVAEWFPGPEPDSAVLDLASASGLPAVSDVLDAPGASTYGTGLVLLDALEHGVRDVTLCLGGSATTDGGRGILAALGAFGPASRSCAGSAGSAAGGSGSPSDAAGSAGSEVGGSGGADRRSGHDARPAAPGAPAAGPVVKPLPDHLDPRLRGMRWTLLLDVTTTPEDCAAVFAPQKGADDAQVAWLAAYLADWCRACGADPRRPGYGAAGSVPVGIDWLVRAAGGHLATRRGAEHVARAAGLPGLIDGADLVITGEGAVDAQSGAGKVVGHVLDLAAPRHVPVAIAAGRIDAAADVVTRTADTATLRGPMDRTRDALRDAGADLTRRALRRRRA
ncbi:glycerate kinase [Corynebacterium sp. 335C]